MKSQTGEQIQDEIVNVIAAHRRDHTPSTTWKPPRVAFAAAADPLFARLKTVIGPTHATPDELLPTAETVIVYFLPFTEDIPRSNADGDHASRAWATAYVETNALLTAINAHLATFLRAAGHRATVVPPTHNFDEQRLMSDWSHKHVAYIAGLGTFGIHHMLITADGCCGRLNSLVTDLVIPPTPRPEVEACLYKADGSCRACLPRCPVDALTGPRFDRHACYDVCLQNAARHAAVGLADVCGKCACVVPCSFVNPNRHLGADLPR